MEKLAMRIMLLVVMGTFLLLSGIFMDVMGSQINSSSSQGRPSTPFNPLVLVGRCVLAVGVAMLGAAVFFTVRERFSEKRRSEFQRESTSPDILEDTTSNNNNNTNRNQLYSQNPLLLQSMPMPSPPRSQNTSYSDVYISQHREYPHESHLFGRHLMNYPSAPTLPRHHTTTLTDHQLRYSETYADRAHIRFSTVSDSPAEALITAYRLPARATSPYLEDEEVSRYSGSPHEHAFEPVRYHNRWERHPERVSVIRAPSSDLPPPYESTDIPPAYLSLNSNQRVHHKI